MPARDNFGNALGADCLLKKKHTIDIFSFEFDVKIKISALIIGQKSEVAMPPIPRSYAGHVE